MNDTTQSQGESTPLPPLICSAFDDLLEREWNRGDFPSGLKRPLMEAMRATAGWVMDRIEDGGEANMLRTGKLEGMHYQALKSLREDLRIPRKPNAELRDRYLKQTPPEKETSK